MTKPETPGVQTEWVKWPAPGSLQIRMKQVKYITKHKVNTMKRKKLGMMNVKDDVDLLSRDEMKLILAGCGIVCNYYVSGGWTGSLDRCYTVTTQGEVSAGSSKFGGSVSASISSERCCYKAYDPYDMGYSGEKCINGAKARQC